MPRKQVIQAGHALALVFVALLLVGARGFLAAHPLVSALLLALFAPVYFLAARITGLGGFLYPATLLLVLAYQLLWHAAGLPLAQQPRAALVPLGILYLLAAAGRPRSIPRGAPSLHGANNLLLTLFGLWILVRATWFYAQAPLSTALALAGFAVLMWLRFRGPESPWYTAGMAGFGSAAFAFLLYAHSGPGLLVGAVLVLLIAGGLYLRRAVDLAEAAAGGLAAVYLFYVALAAPRASQLPLGWLALAAVWFGLALLLHRGERAPLMGPLPAPLPRLLPLFAAGLLAALLPLVAFYPWQPMLLALAYLAILFLITLIPARALARSPLSLVAVALTRLLSLLARAAPLAALAYLLYARFPSGLGIGAAELALAALSVLAAWLEPPRVLTRRCVYLYQGALFLSLAYFAIERSLALSPGAALILDSAALLVVAMIAAAYLLRDRVPHAFAESLLEAAAIPAAVACAFHAWREPVGLAQALALGVLLLAACALGMLRLPRPATLFTAPVVLGFWMYVLAWKLGVRAEALGLPYLVLGLICAGAGYALLRRHNRWHQLLYFMWILCVGVSLALFYPYRGIGAWAAPLWPLAFLLVARARETLRDFPVSLALEIVSTLLVAASAVVLLFHGLYLAAAVALLWYALLYTWMAASRQLWFYLYPAALCAVGACFLAVLDSAGARLFLPYFLPLAIAMYGIAVLLRGRAMAVRARPVELAVALGAVAGGLLFLALPFGAALHMGWLTGIAWFILYMRLVEGTRERGYLAGAGLAAALALYQALPLLPGITPANRLAVFAPAALVLAAAGRWRSRAADLRGAWALYAAAIAATALVSGFAIAPAPASFAVSRVVLAVALLVWLALLVWTQVEAFIYCATLGLALLAYNFVQSSEDIFGRHLVVFFLYGAILLGLVFAAAVARRWMRFRGPLLLAPPEHWYRRVAYLVPIAILALATFGSWGVSTSSNPQFCGTCHGMKTYFANWKSSAHARADISCAACHYQPGVRGYMRAKMKGASELVTTLTGTQGYKPVAEVNNSTCLASGCHSLEQLARPLNVRGKFRFDHTRHLGALARGPELRCTSCHAGGGTEAHFALDTNACFTCHFAAASDPRPATAVGCVACHGLVTAGEFDHAAAGVHPADQACASCHQRVAAGSPAVELRQCRHCHSQAPETLAAAGSPAIHRRHVAGRGIACDWCHGVVRHGALDFPAAARYSTSETISLEKR